MAIPTKINLYHCDINHCSRHMYVTINYGSFIRNKVITLNLCLTHFHNFDSEAFVRIIVDKKPLWLIYGLVYDGVEL